jgi:hypothetical protein
MVTCPQGVRQTMERDWSIAQAKMFVQQVRRETGNGWDWMVPAVRRALIAERAFAVVRGQARESVAIKAMDALLRDMLVIAGLEDDTSG